MEVGGNQAEHIAKFVEQASSLNGAELIPVVVEATSHPSVFAFSEILAVPNILELEGTENSYYVDLLRIFAYGTWSEYKNVESRLPQLVPYQVLKLKQLTVLTLAETTKVLAYDKLMQELDVSNIHELEDFLIRNCIYVGIVTGKLNQLKRCFEVQFAAGRDIRPEQLGSLIKNLKSWISASDNILVSIQERIKWVKSMSVMDSEHKVESNRRVEEAKRISKGGNESVHEEEQVAASGGPETRSRSKRRRTTQRT